MQCVKIQPNALFQYICDARKASILFRGWDVTQFYKFCLLSV